MKLAVGYYRMSKDDQVASIPAQREAVRKWAKANGYKIIAEYLDEGISGDATEKRLQFQKMIRDGQAGQFKAIIVWEIGRLGRFDSIEAGYWLFPLRQAGIDIITLDRGILDWHDFAGRIVWGVEQEMKHSFLLNLSRDVMRGKLKRAKEGLWNGGNPPRGYRLENGKLIVVPHDAALVKRIYRDFLGGQSLRGIAERLNLEGLRSRTGKQWMGTSVRVILTQPLYLGGSCWNRKNHGKYVRAVDGDVQPKRGLKGRAVTPNSPAEWIEVDGCHEPIIDQATFDAVQRRLVERRGKTTPHRNGGEFLFTGMLRCAACGSAMTGAKLKHRIYWICSGYHMRGREHCERRSARQDKLLKLVVDALADRFSTVANVRRFRSAFGDRGPSSARSSRRDAERRVAAASTEVGRLKSRLCEVDTDLLPVVQERLRAAIVEHEAAQTALDESAQPKTTVEYEKNRTASAATVIFKALKDAASSSTPGELRRFLERIVSRIVVGTSGNKVGKRTKWSLSYGEIEINPEIFAELVHRDGARRSSYTVKFGCKQRKRRA